MTSEKVIKINWSVFFSLSLSSCSWHLVVVYSLVKGLSPQWVLGWQTVPGGQRWNPVSRLDTVVECICWCKTLHRWQQTKLKYTYSAHINKGQHFFYVKCHDGFRLYLISAVSVSTKPLLYNVKFSIKMSAFPAFVFKCALWIVTHGLYVVYLSMPQ